jgi:hypothetical protein
MVFKGSSTTKNLAIYFKLLIVNLSMDAFYKRIFWSVGPQFIGGLIGFMACEEFMVNVLGFTQFR